MWPSENPYSQAKAELGKVLYFDKRLSADGTVACASCHAPEFGFTDGKAVSTGIKAQVGGRSAPTVINRAYSLAQFWDGRAATLEDQAKGPYGEPDRDGKHARSDRDQPKRCGIPGAVRPGLWREIDIDRVAMAIARSSGRASGNAPLTVKTR
jgi:cytochrome c peroxidase